METCEIISEEWSSLSGLYTAEESEFMTQFLGNCFNTEMMCGYGNFNVGIPSSSSSSSSLFWPSESMCFPSSVADGLHNDNFGSMSMGFPCNVQRNIEHFGQQISEAIEEEEDEMKNCAKRCRSSEEIPSDKRNIKSKKNPKSSSTSNGQNPSNYCSSEDDSSASQEEDGNPKNSKAFKSNGKSRSNGGPATDPQSVYARRRRERINERLRILQNLVPNGTKVDISTMLEEAVQYVKFLQLQIKLLSSDDLWMYAPIAYNGLNIGLDLNITPTKQP